MFITSNGRGYTRNGEQRAAGRFLVVFAHNAHKWEEQNNVAHTELTGQTFDVLNGDGFTVQRVCTCGGRPPYTYGPDTPAPYYYLKQCPVHSAEYRKCPMDSRKLYAYVCHVSMKQCGHFMMGIARALPVQGKDWKYEILSGTYGSDGLPCDYEDLTDKARAKLVEVPADLADKFWSGGGHNSAGSEAGAMREWALQTFKVGVRK